MAGILRQRDEDNIGLALPPVTFFPNELASLVVHPNYRGKGLNVARDLVTAATTFMSTPTIPDNGRMYLPVAVCNPAGRKVFHELGYQHVGGLVSKGNPRDVLVFPPENPVLYAAWRAGQRRDIIRRFPTVLPRFAGMTVLDTI